MSAITDSTHSPSGGAAAAGSAPAGTTAAAAEAAQRRELASRAGFADALTEITGLARRTLRMFDPTAAAFGSITGEKGHGQRQITLGIKLLF